MRRLMIASAVLLLAATAPLMGSWAVVAAGLLLMLLGVGSRVHTPRPGRLARLGMLVGLLGGIVGVYSAAGALVALGGLPGYGDRAGFGWAALVLALLASTGGFLAPAHRLAAGLLMMGAGFLGSVAINFFYINTFYLIAGFLWLVGAALVLLEPRKPRP